MTLVGPRGWICLDVMKSGGHGELADMQELHPDPGLEFGGRWWVCVQNP